MLVPAAPVNQTHARADSRRPSRAGRAACLRCLPRPSDHGAMTGVNSGGSWDDSDSGGQPCAAGKHCAEADYEGNPQHGPRPFCHTDELRVGTAIRDLPRVYAEVHAKIGKSGAGHGEQRVSGGGWEAPAPVDLDVDAFLRQAVLVALTWEERVRHAAGLSNPNLCPACQRSGAGSDRECPACDVLRVRDGAALSRACRLLAGPDRERTGHLATLLALAPEDVWRPVKPDEAEPGAATYADEAGDWWQRTPMGGAEAGVEFLRLAGKARGILGISPRRQRVPLRCDGCGSLTLVQREALAGDWEDVIRCTNCPRVYAGADYEELMTRWWKLGNEAAKAGRAP